MREVIVFLLSLLPIIILYGVGVAVIWLGLRYDNVLVIAAGVIFTLMLRWHISTNNEKEEK